MPRHDQLPEGFGHFKPVEGSVTLEIRPEDEVFTVGGQVHVTIGRKRVQAFLEDLRRENHDEECERIWHFYTRIIAEDKQEKGWSFLSVPHEAEAWARERGLVAPWVQEQKADDGDD